MIALNFSNLNRCSMVLRLVTCSVLHAGAPGGAILAHEMVVESVEPMPAFVAFIEENAIGAGDGEFLFDSVVAHQRIDVLSGTGDLHSGATLLTPIKFA